MSLDTLTREQIIRAAIELLDADGHEGLSMRRLGGKLGAGATSLYWYVKSKDALYALAADEVFGEIDLPDPGELGWRAAVTTMAHGLRETILRHPWLAPVFGSQPIYGPKALRWLDHSLTTFEAAGFTGTDADTASDTVFAFVLGMTLAEAAMTAQLRRTGVDEQTFAAEVLGKARDAAAEYPRLRARFETRATADQRQASEQSFDIGLRTILDGLEARLAA